MVSQDNPENDGAATESAWRRIPAGYKIGGAALALIVLMLLGSYLHFRSRINAEHAAIRSAGLPVTLRELSDYYPTPAGENAAFVYLAAFASFADPPPQANGKPSALPIVGAGKLPKRGDPLPADMKTAIAAYLAANAKALELLHKAASINGCRYPVDFSLGSNTRLPHLAQARQAARLLDLEAVLKADEGKADAAASAVMACLSVARSVWNEPLLISQLVRFAANSLSLRALERVLSKTALTDPQLAELSKALAAADSSAGFRRGMAGERCAGEDLFGRWGPGYDPTGSGSGGGATYYLWKASGVSVRDRTEYLRLMGLIVSAAGGTPKEMRDLPPEIEKQIAQAPKHYILTRMLILALTRAAEEQLKSFARLRAARTALAVERFRVANGWLPRSLDELVPKFLDAVPADPFNDKPIQYVKLVKGFVTWSVGPDLADNRGAERVRTDSDEGWDVTFIVAR